MDNSTAKTERRDRITAALKYACRFIPALILAVLMIIALTDVHFVLSDAGTSGAKSYDPTYLILMIVMLGLSVIVPLLGDGVAKYIAGGARFLPASRLSASICLSITAGILSGKVR